MRLRRPAAKSFLMAVTKRGPPHSYPSALRYYSSVEWRIAFAGLLDWTHFRPACCSGPPIHQGFTTERTTILTLLNSLSLSPFPKAAHF